MDLETLVHDVPDFPEPGVVFKDITPLLRDTGAFQSAIAQMADHYRGHKIDTVVGIESRGFIFGAPLALELDAGFVPARKSGKLPRAAITVEFSLEYGTAQLELHEDGVVPGNRVLIADDVLATGGTMVAARDLVAQLGGEIVGMAVLLELGFLKGRAKLDGFDVFSVLQY